MGLISEQKQPQIAEENIICYKILIYDEERGCFYTPYQNVVIPKIPYVMENSCIENVRIWTDFDEVRKCSLVYVDQGYIHAFCEMDEDIAMINKVFVKCIIPKGVEYWKGIDGDICAKKLQLLEIIPFQPITNPFYNVKSYYPTNKNCEI